MLYYLMNGSSFVLIFNFNKEDSKIMDYMLQNFSQFYVREISMTNLPVPEIVKRVGYIDNSSFSRKFKAVMGMTPAEYRRNFHVSEKKDG